MVSGKANIKEWFKIQNKSIFAIYRRGKEESGNPVFTNRDRENESMETACAFLDQCLSLISTGDFFMFCYAPGGSSSKGRSETHFTISMNEAPPPAANAQQNISGINGGFDYETMMTKAEEMAVKRFQQLQAEEKSKHLAERVTQLEKENRDLVRKVDAPWHKFAESASPYIGSIIEQVVGKRQMAISGVHHDTHLEENSPATLTDDQVAAMNTAVNDFCEALAARYPTEWIGIIQKLTNAIKNDPGKIDMAIKFL